MSGRGNSSSCDWKSSSLELSPVKSMISAGKNRTTLDIVIYIETDNDHKENCFIAMKIHHFHGVFRNNSYNTIHVTMHNL